VWKGEMRQPTMPVAYLKIGKSYVSFHLMGLYADSSFRQKMLKELLNRSRAKPVLILRKKIKRFLKSCKNLLHWL